MDPAEWVLYIHLMTKAVFLNKKTRDEEKCPKICISLQTEKAVKTSLVRSIKITCRRLTTILCSLRGAAIGSKSIKNIFFQNKQNNSG
jgi:hypothetical protein